MEIAERLGDELLWAERRAGVRLARDRRRASCSEGFDDARSARSRSADREQRPFLAFMGVEHPRPADLGPRRPRRGAGLLRAPAAACRTSGRPPTGRRSPTASAAATSRAARSPRRAALLLRREAGAGSRHSLEPLLDLWDGRWDEVEALAARRSSRRAAAPGNRWDEWASHHLAARVRYLRGDLDGAPRSCWSRRSPIVVDGGARYFELWVRPDLARVCAPSAAGSSEARAHADRCREIVGGGEDWRGRAGHVALAEAVVLACEDRMDEADARVRPARRRRSSATGCAATRRMRCTSGGARSRAPAPAPRPRRSSSRRSRSTAATAPEPLGRAGRGRPCVRMGLDGRPDRVPRAA